MQKTGLCLSDIELNDYLSGSFSRERKAEIEEHLKDCAVCLEKLVFVYETVKEFGEAKQKGVKSMKSSWKKNIWLLASIATFALSFFTRHYFMQLLVATSLLGAKWIFDSVNARILIMIYEAWKKGGEKEASKILQNLNDRLNR